MPELPRFGPPADLTFGIRGPAGSICSRANAATARLYARMRLTRTRPPGRPQPQLVASLAADAPLADGGYHIQIDQGVSMSRPSLVEATARKEQGRLTEVSVGGHAIIVGRGVMTLGAR